MEVARRWFAQALGKPVASNMGNSTGCQNLLCLPYGRPLSHAGQGSEVSACYAHKNPKATRDTASACPLPLRPALVQRETIPSFVSRLAAFNGVSSVDFAIDIGGSLKRVINLDVGVIQAISQLGDLSSKELAALRSWTGETAGNVRISFRDEIFVSRALRSPTVRGCPVCLREDAQAHYGPSTEAMAMRGDWQLREVSICVRHCHPLVQLWQAIRTTERYNIGARLAAIQGRIVAGDFDQPHCDPSPYDLWLDGRLEDGRDITWLADHTLYAATTFCRLLGMELLRLENRSFHNEVEKLRAAQAAGFHTASRGDEAIRVALDRLVAHASGYSDEPHKAFGKLFSKLSRDYLNEDGFTPFRLMMRERILAHWPIATGEVVAGMPLPERRLHSLNSAAHEAGVSAGLLQQFLIAAGALPSDDTRPPNRKVFDAKRYASLLEEIPKLVGSYEMRMVLGATKSELTALVDDGVLVPRIRAAAVKSPWRLSDGLALRDELLAKVTAQVDANDLAWEGILNARRRIGVRVGQIIAAILSGQLPVGHRRDLEGFRGLLVLKNSIDQMKAHAPSRQLTPAAAFGCTVGLRDNGSFVALLVAGHTPATRMKHPKTGVEMFFMTEEDISAFHQRFMTLTTMASEFGESALTVLSRIKAADIRPFAPNGESYGHLYLRYTAVVALRRHQAPSSNKE
jgi:hypothetical protein